MTYLLKSLEHRPTPRAGLRPRLAVTVVEEAAEHVL